MLIQAWPERPLIPQGGAGAEAGGSAQAGASAPREPGGGLGQPHPLGGGSPWTQHALVLGVCPGERGGSHLSTWEGCMTPKGLCSRP